MEPISGRGCLEDLGLSYLIFEWFTNFGVKCYNYVADQELVYCEFIDFDFLRNAKFPFAEKLEKLGCKGVFDVSNNV